MPAEAGDAGVLPPVSPLLEASADEAGSDPDSADVAPDPAAGADVSASEVEQIDPDPADLPASVVDQGASASSGLPATARPPARFLDQPDQERERPAKQPRPGPEASRKAPRIAVVSACKIGAKEYYHADDDTQLDLRDEELEMLGNYEAEWDEAEPDSFRPAADEAELDTPEILYKPYTEDEPVLESGDG